MKSVRRITVHVPAELLRKAQESAGVGISQTVRRGLQLVAAGRAYAELRKLKGKVPISIDLEDLRKDR